jgi:hypothetical protein
MWVDFVRSLAPKHLAASMQTHLESGCCHCHETYMNWSLLLEFAKRESSYNPPDHVVRAVKAAFLLQQELHAVSGSLRCPNVILPLLVGLTAQ